MLTGDREGPDPAFREPAPPQLRVQVQTRTVEDQQVLRVWGRLVGTLRSSMQLQEEVLAQVLRDRAAARQRQLHPAPVDLAAGVPGKSGEEPPGLAGRA